MALNSRRGKNLKSRHVYSLIPRTAVLYFLSLILPQFAGEGACAFPSWRMRMPDLVVAQKSGRVAVTRRLHVQAVSVNFMLSVTKTVISNASCCHSGLDPESRDFSIKLWIPAFAGMTNEVALLP
jgi:hypothetical protein